MLNFAVVRLNPKAPAAATSITQSELYTSGYTDEALDAWAAKVRRWRRTHDVYVYFDNDVKVRAPADAMSLATKLGVGRTIPID